MILWSGFITSTEPVLVPIFICQTVFRMSGVPVVPKIYSIQYPGLAYMVRSEVSEKRIPGQERRHRLHVVAVNPQSFKKDNSFCKAGWIFCTTAPRFCTKSLSGPTSIMWVYRWWKFAILVSDARQRQLFKNIVYGVHWPACWNRFCGNRRFVCRTI